MAEHEQCYPCSVYRHECVTREEWVPGSCQRRRREVPLLPYSNVESNCLWFDVALWVHYREGSFPSYAGYVEAVNAYAAVEQMMQFYHLRDAAYVSARMMDGLLIYRAYQVHVCF